MTLRTLLYAGVAGLVVVAVGLTAWQVSRAPAVAFREDALPQAAATKPSGETVMVSIADGEGAQAIADKLQASGVIRSALLFRVLAALEGVEDRLGAGEYLLEKGMTAAEVVERLRRGLTLAQLVTVREGLRVEEVAMLLEERGVVSRQEFLGAAAMDYRSDFDFLRGLPPGASLEGYLFPDTYDFPKDAAAKDVVRQMLANFGGRFGPSQREAATKAGLSIHQVVTLASIVEREAQVPSERPIIASVFLRRLALDMMLGADPTVQYALARDPQHVARYGYWKGELTPQDLRVDSPYNTYRYAGLPPGPIANPGLASLMAVLSPAPTDYLYFVAKPDGSHAFARTFEEHQRNVRRYQSP